MTTIARLIGILGVALLVNTVQGQGTAQPAVSQVVTGNGNGNGKSSGQDNKPDKGKPDAVDAAKQLLDKIKADQAKFLQDQKDLARQLKDAKADQRDAIRNEMRDKRDEFLQQQKDMREEYRKRIDDLKAQLKDHGDVIDNAKEQAKDQAHQRKGGGN